MGSPLAANRLPLRTVSIGAAAFDLFLRTAASALHTCNGKRTIAFEVGSKQRIETVIGCSGGGAANTSVGLSRLGMNAAFCGMLSDDQWGEILRTSLEREHVDVRFAPIIEHETASFSIVLLLPNGERTILNDPGVTKHLHDVTFDRSAAAEADAIYFNHIHADSCVIEDDLLALKRVKPSIHLTWNPGGNQLKEGLQKASNRALITCSDLLLLNKEEALAFSNTQTEKDALHALIEAGTKVVCITDGPQGATATDGKTLYHCPALDGNVVDTTGAGDAFGSAMTWALLQGFDLPMSVRAGTINAQSVVQVIGAEDGLLTDTQMHSKLQHTPDFGTMQPFYG